VFSRRSQMTSAIIILRNSPSMADVKQTHCCLEGSEAVSSDVRHRYFLWWADTS